MSVWEPPSEVTDPRAAGGITLREAFAVRALLRNGVILARQRPALAVGTLAAIAGLELLGSAVAGPSLAALDLPYALPLEQSRQVVAFVLSWPALAIGAGLSGQWVRDGRFDGPSAVLGAYATVLYLVLMGLLVACLGAPFAGLAVYGVARGDPSLVIGGVVGATVGQMLVISRTSPGFWASAVDGAAPLTALGTAWRATRGLDGVYMLALAVGVTVTQGALGMLGVLATDDVRGALPGPWLLSAWVVLAGSGCWVRYVSSGERR